MSRSLPPFQLPLIFFVAEQDWQLSLSVIISRCHFILSQVRWDRLSFHFSFQLSAIAVAVNWHISIHSASTAQIPHEFPPTDRLLHITAFGFQFNSLDNSIRWIQPLSIQFFLTGWKFFWLEPPTAASDFEKLRIWETSDFYRFSCSASGTSPRTSPAQTHLWISYRFFLQPERLYSIQCPDKFWRWKTRVTPWIVSRLLTDWEINLLRTSRMSFGTLFRDSPPSSVSCSPRSKRIRFSRSRHRRAHPRRGIQGTRWNQFWWCSGNSLIELIFAFAMLSGYWSPIFAHSPKGSTSRRTGSCGLQGVSAEQKSYCCS